jgi:hypothetical protein
MGNRTSSPVTRIEHQRTELTKTRKIEKKPMEEDLDLSFLSVSTDMYRTLYDPHTQTVHGTKLT